MLLLLLLFFLLWCSNLKTNEKEFDLLVTFANSFESDWLIFIGAIKQADNLTSQGW